MGGKKRGGLVGGKRCGGREERRRISRMEADAMIGKEGTFVGKRKERD